MAQRILFFLFSGVCRFVTWQNCVFRRPVWEGLPLHKPLIDDDIRDDSRGPFELALALSSVGLSTIRVELPILQRAHGRETFLTQDVYVGLTKTA